MSDQSALLNQLRIDRGDEPAGGSGGGWLKWLVLALSLVAAAGVAWAWMVRDAGVPVRVVTAQASAGGGASAGASLLDASGYVVARRAATVSAKITGKVVDVLIEEGRRVRANEIVARLDDSNIRAALNSAMAQLEASRALQAQTKVSLANAERDVARKRGLVEQKFVSAAELDTSQTNLDVLRATLATAERNVDVAQRTVEVSQRNLDDTVVRAPFTGVITVKAAQVGEIVSPLSAGGGFTRTGIGTIVDMDSLEVEVDVNESFINRVQADQPARVRLNAYPDWDIPAYVIAVIPTADRSKATVKVRVGFKEKDERILPEMGARVSFLSPPKPADESGAGKRAVVVTVPKDAVDAKGDGGVVWVVNADHVERRAVKLGAASGDDVVVLSGLTGGERVAIGDLAKLVDGGKIAIADGR